MYNLRSLLIPILVTLTLLWVFSRPLSALGLFVYNISGSVISTAYDNIRETQENAVSLLEAQKLAKKLQLENKKLKVQNIEIKAQNKKIIDYERALNFKTAFNHPAIFARITGRSPDSWHKQILIDKGSADGVVLGRGVLTEHGIIGQVAKVTSHNAVVELVYNPDSRMGVKIARLNQYGVLSGNHPDPARLQFITVDSDVKAGDEIVTSGICIDSSNCPYPENFPVGQVISVERDPSIVDLLVKVRFYEDLGNLKEVFVLK